MEIRQLTEHDADAFWRLRLRGLENDPWSFGESAEELRKIKVEEYATSLRTGVPNNFVFGAFEEGALVGVTGFYREQGLKRLHKGWIWGVFVSPEARGLFLADAIQHDLRQFRAQHVGANALDQIVFDAPS